MKRILTYLLLNLISIFISRPCFGADIQVIQVKRNIPLADDEPIYKDYYLSGGKKEGLKPNLVVSVMRWVNLRENNQSQDQSMKILEPVGWLKIIYVQDHLAVARVYEMSDSELLPIMEQQGILMGDVVTLDKSYISKGPKKVSQNEISSVVENSIVSNNRIEAPPMEKTDSSASVSNPEKVEDVKSERVTGAPMTSPAAPKMEGAEGTAQKPKPAEEERTSGVTPEPLSPPVNTATTI